MNPRTQEALARLGLLGVTVAMLVVSNVIFWGGMYLLLAALISLPGCSLL